MRAIWGLTVSLLLLVGNSQAGLVHRRTFRDVAAAAAPAAALIISEPVPTELRKDQIPVTVIELQEPVEQEAVAAPLPKQPEQSEKRLEAAAAAPVASEIKTPQTEILLPPVETAEIAEDIAKAVEEDQQLPAVAAVVEAQRRQDYDVDLLLTEAEEEQQKEEMPELKKEVAQEQQQTLEQLSETKKQPEATKEQVILAAVAVPSVEQAPTDLKPPAELLRTSAPVAAAVAGDEQPQPVAAAEQVVEKESVPVAAADADSSVRQATQATPTQSSTPQNFVQFLQNTPVGQFITQLTGQQQQQTQPLAALPQPANVAADEPVAATPAPTVPGFLNPGAAITSAVQNAAQGFVNSTQQAIQGIQQFASNLGTQFFGNQPNTDSTTPRPPGPIQSLISNFVGGNNIEPTTAAPGQSGPLQGILSFFQGGNRPQAATNTAATNNLSPAIQEGAAAASAASVDDKIEDAAPADDESVANNEVRASGEIVEDSFEEVKPEEMIIVEDDAAPEQENVA